MAEATPLRIAVVHCTGGGLIRRQVSLPAPATVGDAIRAARLFAVELIRPEQLDVGIYGRRCGIGDPLADGDRVEIYRPLEIEPKAARRLRAEAKARVRQR